MTRGFAALIVALAFAAPARADAPPTTLRFPLDGATAPVDKSINFSWDYVSGAKTYQVVFSPNLNGDWTSPTLPASLPSYIVGTIVSPTIAGLAAGTWYWRVCTVMQNDPTGTCWFNSGISRLTLTAPTPVTPSGPSEQPTDEQPTAPALGLAKARKVARYGLTKRLHAVAPTVRCTLTSDTYANCVGTWKKKGKRVSRKVWVESRADGIYYGFG